MAAAPPAYDYSAYGYSYETSSSSAAYPGYETYVAPGTYDGYAASAAYHTGTPAESSYATVDPYSGYPSTSQPVYPSSSSSSSYAYDSRYSTPPSTHYAAYDYTSSPAGSYATTPSSSSAYSPYKTVPATSNIYATSAPPPYGAYGVPPGSHLSGAMGPPQRGTGMIPHRPAYYLPSQASHPMPYRLPPRGAYQRELDESGDENALLRHVVYIIGLPKEIQNETLAEVFGAACGPIAPVDVRSPKAKIWVYKDRQTREGKGEATITFINPDSAQMAISYFNGKELFGREIHVTLCPRRMYNMQKQNTPFNPAAPSMNTTIPISSMVKPKSSDNNGITTTPAIATTPSNSVTVANPIATISSSTLGLPRQLNHSLFKLRQTPDQQRGLLPTPPVPFGTPMMNGANQRDGVRKELPRVALNRGNYVNPAGIRPKPY